ncbi:MAG: gliding motility-associated C-terminal domain-containing protein, partial [Bacteroidales bacterium]
NLRINENHIDTIDVEICYGEVYNQFGFNEDTAGFYKHSFQTIKGCDSIVNLNLRINPIFNDTIFAEICQGEIYNQNGFNISIAGLNVLNLQTNKGCDSLVNLVLVVNPIFNDTIEAGICRGEVYNENGFSESLEGFYTHSSQTIKGCDSIISINLSYLDYYDTIQAVICEGETYNQFGFNEINEGFYKHSFQTITGCDSILNLDLKVNEIYNDTIIAEICNGEVYNQFGFIEDLAGFYQHRFQTINGCDSIVNLCLKINPTYHDTFYVEICQGEVYNQNGFSESLEGFYTHSYQTIKGCDSIINLKLVNPDYVDTIVAEICQGGVYNQNGFNETNPGFYSQNLQSIKGCDSIISLSLKVNPTYNISYNSQICQGTYYTLYGFNESSSGVYSQVLSSLHGCDSIVNLELSVIETPINYSLIDDKYIIAEDLPITIDVSCENCISYYWNTGSEDAVYEINQIGQYYVTIRHKCGKVLDSVLIAYPEVYVFVPNSFTPLEITNNTFFPVFESIEKVFVELFEIYNRWGEKIYSSKTRGWDGTYKGKLISNGVYIWRLLYKTKYSGDRLFEKTGEINLIR